MGSPGTGKTLLARATAGEAGVPFFSISGSEFVEMFVGVGAARMRDLFEQAKRSAPDIVFIDEIDTIGKVRSGASAVGGHEEREQTLDQLLTEMDGFDPSLSVIIMAATNRPDVLDPALLRPGRFDRQVVVDRPDMAGREEILKVHVRKIRLAPDVDFHVIASRTPGFVGADLANVVNEAALLASRHGKEAVSMAEFDEAIDRAVSGLERKSRIISEQEKEIVSYHEMGHALVALQLPYADPVQKVTIVPRGVAALGMTLQLPLQDKYLFLKEELEDRIAVSLGGRASEELRFGRITTGAHNDLITATQLARRMVREFGMSEKLGLIAFGDDRNAVSGRLSFGGSKKEYSEETARLIDEEIRAIIDSNHTRAVKVLEDNKEILEILAKELMEKETISGAELKQRFESLKREAALSLATNC
jgi:cell division protease FtsH